jgi:eight-cysteine-cluster-containing protein
MIKRGSIIVVLLILVSGCQSVVEENKCAVGGCSGQVCTTGEMAKDLVTTCEYKEEYGCLELSNCKVIDGECGWEDTPEYLDCLEGVRI